MNNSEPALPPEAVQALQKGNRLGAIKHVSRINGTSLKRSKEIVDLYIESRPDMKKHLSSMHVSRSIIGLGFMIALGLAGWYWVIWAQ
ncbi:hypothetical protein J2T55_002637 [Methylohalomonas lacus]|uniref:Uncharacterized protein n=1 Tax=Methylohalomonas lacus TaxID=398773 RepID=A0AAE3HNJ1_9GAMM|nr:hypothetical protein [Methylohalomonas lacus]MCS3904597.1 hypothetical protein [Methylohalomonas lacus]